MRFLGRKVFLGVIVVLISAMEHGLTPKRRKQLIEDLDLYPKTISHWRKWWREIFPVSRCWRAEKGNFMPPIEPDDLPGALVGPHEYRVLPIPSSKDTENIPLTSWGGNPTPLYRSSTRRFIGGATTMAKPQVHCHTRQSLGQRAAVEWLPNQQAARQERAVQRYFGLCSRSEYR